MLGRIDSLVLVFLNLAIVMVMAWPAHAQPAAPSTDVVGFAVGEIIRTGIVGAIAVVEALVIRHLYSEMIASKAQYQQFALQQVAVIAKTNEVLDRVEKKLPAGGV